MCQENKLLKVPLKCHTCSYTLHLPCGSATIPMAPDEELFAICDLAFKNSYFGITGI